VKKLSLSQNFKQILNIMWQGQFIAAALPLLAVLFFGILGVVYLRASSDNQQDSNVDRAVQPAFLEPILEQIWCSIKSFLWNILVFVVVVFVGKYPQKNFIILSHNFTNISLIL
jgi:hypothetical protein